MNGRSYEWAIPQSFHDSLQAHEQQYVITSEIPPRWDVADNTRKYFLQSATGDRYFMLVSNINLGNVAHAGAQAAQTFQDALADKAQESVLTAVTIAQHAEYAYAIYPVCYGLSENKLIGRLENLWCFPLALKWHKEVVATTMHTLSSEQKNAVIDDLDALCDANLHSDSVAAEMQQALEYIKAPHQDLRACAVHNDLWRGNMMKTNRLLGGLRVIDWPSMDLAGYPFFDLAKFLIAFRIPKFLARRVAMQYCQIFQCHPSEVLIYTFLSMAQLYGRLDKFPLHMFVDLTERMRGFWVNVLPESKLSPTSRS